MGHIDGTDGCMAHSDETDITDYWSEYYVENNLCTLCGNKGTIDTFGTKTPAGVPVGRKNWCICPNGQILRKHADGELPE